MQRKNTVLLSLLISTVFGCALLGKDIVVKSGELEGRIEDNVYTSPTGTFRLRLPRLSSKGLEIRDETPSQSTVRLTIKDDLCREFIVSQRPGFLGEQSLAEWVDEHIVGPLKNDGFDIQQSKPITTSLGMVISLRYRVRGGAPCLSPAVKDGKPVETRPDADVGWYVFHHGGAVYRIIYVLGLVPAKPSGWVDQWLTQREPLGEVLAGFAEGFEIIAAKNN